MKEKLTWAVVIFVSMVFTLLALGRPASSIRAHLCMSSLNSTATVGSSGIHPASLLPGKKPVVFRRCSQVFLRVATKSRQGARPSALTPPANTSI